MNTSEPAIQQVISTKTFPWAAQDKKFVYKILREAIKELNSKGKFEPEISNARLANYVAALPRGDIGILWKYEQEPVALSLISIGAPFYSSVPVMYERLIYVRKAYRNLRLGTQVLDHSLATAKANGAKYAICGNGFAAHLGNTKGIDRCYTLAGLKKIGNEIGGNI